MFQQADGKDYVVYVSFDRLPQTMVAKYGPLLSRGRFILIDCFASGKGNQDRIFLDFFKSRPANDGIKALRVTEPTDPRRLQDVITDIGDQEKIQPRYVFDSLTGMLDLWGNEEHVIRFFGHICPRLYDLNTIAYCPLGKPFRQYDWLMTTRRADGLPVRMQTPGASLPSGPWPGRGMLRMLVWCCLAMVSSSSCVPAQ